MYMGERIAGKQDRPSLIIEGPSNSQKYTIFLTFLPYMENWFQLFSLVVDMSPLSMMRSVLSDILVPPVPLDFMYGPNMTPFLFEFKLKRFLSD